MKTNRRNLREAALAGTYDDHLADAADSLQQALVNAPAGIKAGLKALLDKIHVFLDTGPDTGHDEYNVMKDNFLESKKLTVSQLRRIIKEETSKILLEYEQVIVRRGGELYVMDDDGNEDYYDQVAGSDYEWLADGETTEAQTGTSPNWGVPSRGRRGW
jgi:hypothetical protein